MGSAVPPAPLPGNSEALVGEAGTVFPATSCYKAPGNHEVKGLTEGWKLQTPPHSRRGAYYYNFCSLKKWITFDPLFAPSCSFLQFDFSRLEYCVFCPWHCKDDYLEQRRFEDGKAVAVAES